MAVKNSSHLANKSLVEWLSYLESIHSTEIDLGLERINQVAQRLLISFSEQKVITVAGTNGKGTTCAFLENALLSEGKSVAVYSSPHIDAFNERLRINKRDITDELFINAFISVEEARKEISLTYYEFTTLAAFLILMDSKPDVIVLEVGLGGRLDATNIIDADIAVITTIDLDHQAFLGNTREKIGFEKAGIMRTGKISVVGDTNIPNSIFDHAKKIGTTLFSRGKEFKLIRKTSSIEWKSQTQQFNHLSLPHIPADNVATGITVLSLLHVVLTSEKINRWIDETKVVGRTELIQQGCDVLLDVGHNPQATRYLTEKVKELKALNSYAKVIAVLGMLKDKDIKATTAPLLNIVDVWHIGSLNVSRGATSSEIKKTMELAGSKFNCFDNVTQAFTMAQQEAQKDDLILVFGSFFTVAEIRKLMIT